MRVISGRFKGHPLVAFDAPHIRPTTDRVKETIFNKLMMDIPDARVLDLFSGTGSLAIEALSRGAAHVECVEKNKKSLRIIRQNLEKLKIVDEIQVHPVDVLRFVQSYQGPMFDVVLVDPPFTQKMAHSVMEVIAKSQVWARETLVVIESSSQERIDDDYGPFKLLDRKSFGDKCVSFFSAEELGSTHESKSDLSG